MYELRFTPGAERYIKKLREKPLKAAYKAAFLRISENPYMGTPKRSNLSGIYGYDLHYRGTNYEIAYKIKENNGRIVVTLLAGTRENFYEQLKRYIN